MESHDNVFAGDIFAAEEITFVAIERADLSIVELHGVAIGPVDRPQPRLEIEQSHSEAFERLAVQFRMKNVEVTLAQQDRAALLCRVKFVPHVAAAQRFFQGAVPDIPGACQIIEINYGGRSGRRDREVPVG